jgi:small conductance mechanosensitive channel
MVWYVRNGTIERVGNGSQDVLDEPQVLGVESLSASGMTLRLTVRTRPGRQWAVQRTMTERVVAALRAEDVVAA